MTMNVTALWDTMKGTFWKTIPSSSTCTCATFGTCIVTVCIIVFWDTVSETIWGFEPTTSANMIPRTVTNIVAIGIIILTFTKFLAPWAKVVRVTVHLEFKGQVADGCVWPFTYAEFIVCDGLVTISSCRDLFSVRMDVHLIIKTYISVPYFNVKSNVL